MEQDERRKPWTAEAAVYEITRFFPSGSIAKKVPGLRDVEGVEAWVDLHLRPVLPGKIDLTKEAIVYTQAGNTCAVCIEGSHFVSPTHEALQTGIWQAGDWLITTGLIYYYFKSKEDVLRAALEERSPVQVMAHITPEMLEQPPDVLLPLLIMRVLNRVESEQFVSVIRVLLPEMLHGSAEVAPIALSFFQRVVAFLSNYLKIQATRGRVRADLDVDAAAQVIASSMIGMVMRRQIMHDPGVLTYTHEEIAQAILGTLFQGIKPH